MLTYQQLLEKPVAELIVQQQRLNQERLGLESALMEIGRLQVRAPLSGVVISQEVQPGDAVVANQVWGYYR